ncbi:hypothetical protein PYV02_01495 [Leifsonia sp. H3M29-4]|uniref:hypothetical protein n=1 Tax=Salinibacterium metalliresistens TaxID=3031321 RepID=UPI0023DCC7F0|nr:hypothetical protein [Salinibacterium metalliresistens]MDF1477753.1 hypothetical protein [Salinibacterium metalliresistens]
MQTITKTVATVLVGAGLVGLTGCASSDAASPAPSSSSTASSAEGSGSSSGTPNQDGAFEFRSSAAEAESITVRIPDDLLDEMLAGYDDPVPYKVHRTVESMTFTALDLKGLEEGVCVMRLDVNWAPQGLAYAAKYDLSTRPYKDWMPIADEKIVAALGVSLNVAHFPVPEAEELGYRGLHGGVYANEDYTSFLVASWCVAPPFEGSWVSLPYFVDDGGRDSDLDGVPEDLMASAAKFRVGATKAGTIVISDATVLHYYTTEGDGWERNED